MTEFHTEIRRQAASAVESLNTARQTGDDYLASVRQSELENLARLADEHGLRIPELAQFHAA